MTLTLVMRLMVTGGRSLPSPTIFLSFTLLSSAVIPDASLNLIPTERFKDAGFFNACPCWVVTPYFCVVSLTFDLTSG